MEDKYIEQEKILESSGEWRKFDVDKWEEIRTGNVYFGQVAYEIYISKIKQNPLFDECELDGVPYVKGDWKKVAVHDEKNVKGFFGPSYRFLSNFHNCLVCHDALPFMSSEHAYMFSKLDLDKYTDFELKTLHRNINNMGCKEVKKWGQTVKLRPDWEEVKYDTMLSIVFDKFYRNKDIREKLLATGDKYLEEKNWWGDVFYGVDYKKGGLNNLGKILMKVRECLKK